MECAFDVRGHDVHARGVLTKPPGKQRRKTIRADRQNVCQGCPADGVTSPMPNQDATIDVGVVISGKRTDQRVV
ncbi:hypothetical protein D3C76_964600 [compost metagenome]